MGSYTERTVMQMIDRVAGVQPLSVTIMNEREAIVELREDDPIIDVSQLIQRLASWEGQSINVSCMISSKRSLLSIIQGGEEMRNKQKELEKEQQLIRDEVREQWQELDFERQMLRKETEAKREELEDKQKLLRGEQNDYRGHLEDLLEHFNEQVAEVELLWNESTSTVHLDIHTGNPSQGTLVGGTMGTPVKLINLPSLPSFSGADPTPKDEAIYEQWLFQGRMH